MKLEILLSCMHQKDTSLVQRSEISGDVLLINQTDEDAQLQESLNGQRVRMISTVERGLSRSRNMAIRNSDADICLLCDDDEVFTEGYEAKILGAYEKIPQADIIVFKMINRPPSFEDKIMRLKFPQTMKVSSWQISFRRESLMRSGVRFDELLGAGTGNGAEEELKFLTDCQKAGLQIYYVPEEIATVGQTESTWFEGYTEQFFINRGATTRYILGAPLAALYAVYYVLRKRSLYGSQISPGRALGATFRGMWENKIVKQAGAEKIPPRGKNDQ